MLQQREFEEMIGATVAQSYFENVVKPMYAATNMSKENFVRLLNPERFKEMERERSGSRARAMLVRNKAGQCRTADGLRYYVKYVELVDVDMKTGKYVVKDLDPYSKEKIRESGKSLDYATEYDFDYTRCVDRRGKAIELEKKRAFRKSAI